MLAFLTFASFFSFIGVAQKWLHKNTRDRVFQIFLYFTLFVIFFPPQLDCLLLLVIFICALEKFFLCGIFPFDHLESRCLLLLLKPLLPEKLKLKLSNILERKEIFHSWKRSRRENYTWWIWYIASFYYISVNSFRFLSFCFWFFAIAHINLSNNENERKTWLTHPRTAGDWRESWGLTM